MPELPSQLVVTDQEQQEVKNKWSTLHKVLARLKAKGIEPPKSPPSTPLPSVETSLITKDNEAFLALNASYLRWVNYISPHIALLDMTMLQIDNEMKHLKTVYTQQAKSSAELAAMAAPVPGRGAGRKPATRTKEEILLDLLSDPRYIALTQERQEVEQEHIMLTDTLEQLMRVLRVISRNVEIKKIDVATSGMTSPHRAYYADNNRRYPQPAPREERGAPSDSLQDQDLSSIDE